MRAARLLYQGGWLLLLCLSLSAQGQTTTSNRTLLVKLTPQYLVVSGYWLEVEQPWYRHPRQSFIFTPQVYAGPTGRPDASSPAPLSATGQPEKVRGLGLQVLHRWYLTTTKAEYPSGLYASYGFNFQRFVVSTDALGWQEVTGPDGLPYYQYLNERREKINRYGATVQMGYQAPILPGRVFLDLYAGAGWRTSQSRVGSVAVSSRYRSGPSDYGHEGFYFPAGFKVGLALR
jgi:hypothetical protein